MIAWYVLKGAAVDFLGTEPFLDKRLSELCHITPGVKT
jgi:hypothetical protein